MVNFESYMNAKKNEEALRIHNNMLFDEVLKLQKQLKEQKSKCVEFIYIVKDAHGDVVDYYQDRNNAIKRIEDNQKKIEQHIEDGVWVFTPQSAMKDHLFHLEVKQFRD